MDTSDWKIVAISEQLERARKSSARLTASSQTGQSPRGETVGPRQRRVERQFAVTKR